jgi:menaquinone-dependent protoporphyrinogen IX oxidase
MLTSREAWKLIEEHAPRGEWLKVGAVYEIVERHADLDEADRRLLAAKGRSAHWHRTVRNALQRQKQAGTIEFARGTGFRLAP